LSTTRRVRGAIAGLAVAGLLIGAGSAQAATFTFSNPSSIQLNSIIQGQALLYPSTIPVSGLQGVTDVNVTLKGFSAARPDDFDVMLGGPGEQASVLMSDLPDGTPGCVTAVSGLNLTFDDEAPAPIPGVQTLKSGTYQPLDNDGGSAGCGPNNTVRPDNYGTAAPDEPNDAPLGIFSGSDANGDWGLFVVGDTDGNTGSIAGGWTLQITTSGKFGLGKLKKNKKKGTAKLTVDVPGPGTVSLGGKGVKAQRPRSGERITAAKAVTEAGTVTFPIKAKGKKKSKLNSTGKVKLKVNVTYTPAGGAADTETKPVKLVDN
jgi:hypothetical protein